MRTIKVAPEKFAAAVQLKAEHCSFMPIPSSKEGNTFTGLLMPAGVWISWPQNLTEDEMKLYVDMYGDVPDLFTPKRPR